MKTITEQEHNAELPNGTPVKVMGVNGENKTVLCDPKSLSSLRKIELNESGPVDGDYISPHGLRVFSVDKNGDGGGFQFIFGDDEDHNPIFQIRVFINVSSQWSDWKSVTLT